MQDALFENTHDPHTLPAEPVPTRSLFRIGEVSRLTGTKPFVLRYWETEFPTLQPVKSPKGHRLYRREDVETVRHIKRLLYDEGFTIAGARRHLGEPGGGGDTAYHAPLHEPVQASAGIAGRTSDDLPAQPQQADPIGRNESPGAQELSGGSFPASSPHRVTIDRKALLDLRDALRSLLTLLESE
jgi:DNA-binding transcriptional MerR regulator